MGAVSTIAVLTAMLVQVNRRSPTRSFSPGATTLAGVVLVMISLFGLAMFATKEDIGGR